MYRSRPEVAQRNEAWKQVKTSLSELGLNQQQLVASMLKYPTR
ncbi:P27 family phage terminase small subunit [Piscirickettsia salmonis]|nr:P27 family phage terminase small subunit [Piscirickettsia salmonis]